MTYAQQRKTLLGLACQKFSTQKSLIRGAVAFTVAAALLMPTLSLSAHSKTLIDSRAKTFNHAPAASPISAQPVMPLITATKTDALLIDNDMDGNADTGDTLKYTVTINNGGSTDATGVTFNDPLDPNTTFVNGTLTTTPIAVNDTYAASGNIQISISAAGGVLANDNDADGNSLTATAGATSANGGNVSMNADGSFTYNPPAGFEGTDTFTYTISDGTTTDSATVTVNVSGMIWFVNNTAGAGGDGRLTSPYNCLVGAGCFDPSAPDNPGDNIFLYSGGGSYNGGLTLLANQRLIGQGAGNSLSAITGITPPPGSLALPATGGASPIIVSAANGINLGTNNLIRGLDIGNTSGTDIAGSNFGTLTVREVNLSGTGQALSLNTGILDAAFTTASSTNSSSTGITLSGVSGILTSGATGVDNSSGAGLQVSSSDADLNFGNTTISATGGTGVSLLGNTGNITFGVLDIAPDAGQRGLLASLNNTGTITSTSGVVTTSNTVAVEISGLTPANRTDLNLTLTSISASNSSHGILLTNTSGSFTVTGDGATAGSGGAIQNMTSRGMSFVDATNITLGFMSLNNVGTINGDDPLIAASTCGSLVTGNNTGCNAGLYLVNIVGASFNGLVMNGGVQQGINGNNVTNFSLSNSQVINFGDQIRENGIQFKGLYGISAISGSTVSGNEADQMLVHNSSGTLTSLTLTGSNFTNSAAPNGNTGFSFSGNGTADMSVIVQNSVFSNNRTDGFLANATGTAAMGVNISGSTFQINGNTAMSVVSNAGANTTFNISSNPTITGHAGNAININLGLPSTGTLQGTIANNVIGTSGVPNSGATGGNGINVVSNGSGALTTAITSNSIHGIQFGVGINVQARDGNNTLNATITGNTINLNSPTATNGILVNSGAVSTDTVVVCADISGNSFTNSTGDEIRVRKRFAGVTFRLPGFAGNGASTTDVNNFLAAQNSLGGGTVSSTTVGAFTGGAPCTAPIALLRQSGAEKAQYLAARKSKASTRPVIASISRLNERKSIQRQKVDAQKFNHSSSKTGTKRNVSDSPNNSKSASAPRIARMPVASTINLNIGTLPAGKSITITFHASINNSVPPGTTQVSNQGTVSGDNFADVLTDDPTVGGTADPTVTPIQAEAPPTISCPAPITEAADAGTCSKSVSFNVTATGSPTPTVDCKIGATSITSPHTFPVGTTTVMCTASNGVEPDASCSFTVTITDPDAPVITVNGANPMTVECGTTFNDPGATANDLCAGVVPVTSSGTVDTNNPGTYTITYTATDGTNTATATRTVNVVDTAAPVITLNGANPMSVECGASFTDPGATATDSCEGTVPVTASGTVNTSVPGSYTITYTATDGTNTSTATRTVNVVDTTAPVITINGANPMTVECHASFTDPGATATDSCAGSVPVTSTNNVNVNVPGSYTVTYTATDGTNTATATRTVNVVDTIAPTVTLNGSNPMIVECHSSFTDPGATATDSCAGNLPVSSASNVNANMPGTYTITYTATDGYNTSTKTRTVIVVDTGLPVINLTGQQITLWPPNHQYVTINLTQLVSGASDGCDGTIDINDVVISKVTSDEIENGNGDGNTNNDIIIAANCKSVQLRSERQGNGNGRVYTIHFRVKDAQGNVATATAQVKVPKSQGNNGGAVDSGVHYTVNGTCP